MIIALQMIIFFRESLLSALDRIIRPYYKRLLALNRNRSLSDDEESEDQVFSEFDDERGVVFYPPMYAQRYAAVSDCLLDERWCGKLEKVVDLGYHDMSFIKYLKEVPGIRCILGVDIESIPLRCSSDLLGCDDYIPKRTNPLQITLYQGNAADPDFRLIGCDAVIGIEMIEHMLPHDLDRLVHTVFGFIKPWVVMFTTPNGDFNVLFKALEKNGLRRLDHFFEWTQEQFHDWCSNIVIRYPEYTVSCKGIGPGPPGTLHLGCCSQMAVFIAKHYHKQQNLNLNSLALVADLPSPNLSDMIGSWDCPGSPTEHNMLCPPDNMESYTDLFADKQSRVTIVIASPSFSFDTFEHRDKTSQCNLDTELGKSFLMFDDEEMCFSILVPRRNTDNRIYEFEDVNSRLNCTTLQVRKFSKATQNLMAKNKLDSLVHTREVVDGIRHLTKVLNINRNSVNQLENGPNIWSNINWGDDAPYWNQYYKIVREYNYPFETKSDDCRILDIISDEINRLIDTQYDEEFSVDVNKLEIPLHHLMRTVEHITDDADKVKDLLEWNGYEIVDDVLIHSRLVVDSASVGSHDDEWHDNDTFSDWDTTDVHSTSQSDGSTMMADYHGRCLRRALDHKVRKLRTMLTGDEDITTELDKILCRLMKLALRTSRGRHTPPPTRWMQCKLLDLLTLTEKAIERRKKRYISTYPLKAIGYDQEDKSKEMVALEKFRDDNKAMEIVDKYCHLMRLTDNASIKEDEMRENYLYRDLVPDDELSVTSTESSKEIKHIDTQSPDIDSGPIFNGTVYTPNIVVKEETKLERTQAWVEEDIEVVPYPNHDISIDNNSGGIDHSTSNARYKCKRSKRHKGISNKNTDEMSVLCKRSQSKHHKVKHDEKTSNKGIDIPLSKKITEKNSSYKNLMRMGSYKYISVDNESYETKPRRKKERKRSSPSKPIPESLIDLCHPKLTVKKNVTEFQLPIVDAKSKKDNTVIITQQNYKVAATEESLFVGIVMDEMEETIALRRTIGTDADVDSTIIENETLIRSVSEEIRIDSFIEKPAVVPENVQSQTIFLNDINEPSTSKGIRHVSMDVQCGPDATPPAYAMLSATTSLTKMPKMFATGIKIEDSYTNVSLKNSTDFGTDMNESNHLYKTIIPRMRSVGLRIRDSDANCCNKIECSSMTGDAFESSQMNVAVIQNVETNDTKFIKPVSSASKIEESGSELCVSPYPFDNSIHSSDVQCKSPINKEAGIMETNSCSKYVRPKLCCGGVYVHSYKDKYESEDVVYQGEWQRYRPKTSVRMKSLSKKTESVVKRKKVNSKEKIPKINYTKLEMKAEPKKSIQMCRAMLIKSKQVAVKVEPKKKLAVSNVAITRPIRPMKNVNKVASKLALCTKSSKTTKTTNTGKKPTLLAPNAAAKRCSLVISATLDKKVEHSRNILNKCYIPLYLRKRNAMKLNTRNKDFLNQSIDTVKTNIKMNKENLANYVPPLLRSKTEEIEKNMLKYNSVPCDNITYMVFQNEIQNKGGTSGGLSNTQSNLQKNDSTKNTPHSPSSLNSSTCSSPNSVATVKPICKRSRNSSIRGNSTLSHRSKVVESGSENTTPTRIKKITKRFKSTKKADGKVSDNKENIPETARNNPNPKESDKVGKSVFITSHKSVFMAHLKTESSSLLPTVNTVIKHKTQLSKSTIKIPSVENTAEKYEPISTLVSQEISANSENSFHVENKEDELSDYGSVNTNFVLDTEHQVLDVQDKTEVVVPLKITSNIVLTEWMDTDKNKIKSNTSSIINAMRQLVEETLDFFDSPYVNDMSIDSETIILSHEDMNSSIDSSFSPTSFKTVITNEDISNILSEKDIENALNRTFDTTLGDESIMSSNDTRLTLTDLDLLSFKSMTSVSKYSEYYLADSEFNSHTSKTNSVCELFERKNTQIEQNPTGTIANQAFSGFSINSEPVVGDQPDYVNLIDSETGSMALDIVRQTASEEVFVSGRSSDSYESCLIDEDAVVPNWLFHIISHQQSMIEASEPAPVSLELPLPLELPMAEPMYDANGNEIEAGVVAGAGAGDGRGIHSDHSQDSSGHGTSLSSSDTSSGQQSEAILIDPFTGQFELLREPSGNTIVIPPPPSDLSRVMEAVQNEILSTPHEGAARNHPLLPGSDVDADVSSLDTDIQDSSDN